MEIVGLGNCNIAGLGVVRDREFEPMTYQIYTCRFLATLLTLLG